MKLTMILKKAIFLLSTLITVIILGCAERTELKPGISVNKNRGEISSLSGDDINRIEGQLIAARASVPPNYPDKPSLLIKSDWPLEWKGYGNPFQLRTDEECAFTSVVHQLPPDLTMQEKMLAFGWVHKNAMETYSLSFEEQLAYERSHPTTEEKGYKSPQVHPAKEIANNWLHYYAITGRKAEQLAEVANWRGCVKLILEGSAVERSDALDRITSPVTGQIMEINHPEFSAGNMYIAGFTPKELREIPGFSLDKLSDIYTSKGIAEDDLVIALYRVYGSKGVVKSGWVLCSKKNPYVGAESW